MQSVKVPPRSIQNWWRDLICGIRLCIEARGPTESRDPTRSEFRRAEIAQIAYKST
jgi:hypothetical protein